MTSFYLVRHGANDWIPRGLAGRAAGTHLNAKGHAQSKALAAHLVSAGINLIISSPLERALQTAKPLADKLSTSISTDDSLLEINFGDWTGKTWEELRELEGWKTFNRFRTGTRIPNGELMIEAQHRVICLIEKLNRKHSGKTIALFTHGDVIRAALTYYLGMPMDFFQRLEIAAASYSILRLLKDAPEVICINRLAPPY